MRNNLLTLLAVSIGLALAGCSREKSSAPKPSSPRPAIVRVAPRPGRPGNSAPADAGRGASWDNIKQHAFEKRAEASTEFERMAADLEDQVQALKTKRSLPADGPTRDWDLLLKELEDARAELRTALGELNRATPDTWGQARDRASQALTRAQDAVANVATRRTS